MRETIDVIRMANALAQHAGHRQSIAARNIAHADTPGYRASDLTPFTIDVQSDLHLRRTRPSHQNLDQTNGFAEVLDLNASVSPNGNSVSLEREMLRSVEIRQQHDLALSVYRSTLGVLRTSLGRGR